MTPVTPVLEKPISSTHKAWISEALLMEVTGTKKPVFNVIAHKSACSMGSKGAFFRAESNSSRFQGGTMQHGTPTVCFRPLTQVRTSKISESDGLVADFDLDVPLKDSHHVTLNGT